MVQYIPGFGNSINAISEYGHRRTLIVKGNHGGTGRPGVDGIGFIHSYSGERVILQAYFIVFCSLCIEQSCSAGGGREGREEGRLYPPLHYGSRTGGMSREI